MARYLLDTNHLSPLVTLGHSLRERVLQRMADGDEFHVATLCAAEVVFGIGILARAEANLVEWNRLKRGFTVLQVELAEAERAGYLQIALRRAGVQLKTVDAIIAAIALRDQLTLLTTDGDFSAVPSLECQNWLP